MITGRDHRTGAAASASASRILGGSATPTAWKTRPTSPVTGVRNTKCLSSCSVSISCRRSTAGSAHPTPASSARRRGGLQEPCAGRARERAEHVAADGLVVLVIDQPGVEDRFGGPEDVLHLKQLAISQHDGECVEPYWCAGHRSRRGAHPRRPAPRRSRSAFRPGS